MKLIRLRIDEAVLPFMNGDSLCGIPSFIKNVDYIKYTYKKQLTFRHIKGNTTWEDIFILFDQLLICSQDEPQRDLAGVSVVKGVLKTIWLK